MECRLNRRVGIVFILFAASDIRASGQTPKAVEAVPKYGKFMGDVIAQWLDDGRLMKLTAPFAYIDPEGERWEAPAGSIVDGASIPQFAWSLIGGPFEGKYRKASV